MDNDILLNIGSKETRYAHLRGGRLHDLIIDRKKARQLTGNIYRGRVTNILHNIQSAFIDIDEGENGFIHMSDIIENTRKFEQLFDMDFEIDYDVEGVKTEKLEKVDIEEVMKPDQPVLVQVVKEPIGSKGARLTSNISIAGRYLVLLPNSPHRGVSRKIEDKKTRERLKKLIRRFEMPEEIGIICRTASAHTTSERLVEEAQELLDQWGQVVEKFHSAKGPTLLFEESDLIKRAVLTAIDKKYDRLLVDDYSIFQKCKRLYQRFSNEHPLRLEYYRDKYPMFEKFNVERELEKALRQKIWLSSGGYLFFERTEAMFTIDVNSGRSTSGDTNVEETLVRINLEAADEIARQLRLRNIGGLVIVDFIDMRYKKNQRRVLDRLKDCMREDSARTTVLAMSEFGLVELTRQRSRQSLGQTLYCSCPYCFGSGRIKNHETVGIEIERALKKVIHYHHQFALKLVVHPTLDAFLSNEDDKDYFLNYAKKHNAALVFETNDSLHLNDFIFYSTTSNQPIET